MSKHMVTQKVIDTLKTDDSKYIKEVYSNIEKRLFSQPTITGEALIARFDGGLLREYNLGNEDVPRSFSSGKNLGHPQFH